MRIYLGAMTRPELKKAHQVAPSHVFGITWTPSDQRTDYIPYIVDNGAFTSTFDPTEWIALLDRLSDHNFGPDFVVLPDKYDDAEATLERHRKYASEVLSRHLTAAAVVQPGMAVNTQVALAECIGAKFVFVGGQNRWKRARGRDIVRAAHDRGLHVHIGNPGGEDGLVWAYRIGADSADTSTVTRNDYWHYLEKLEAISEDHSKGTPLIKGRQSGLSDQFVAVDGGRIEGEVRGGRD